MKFCLINVTVLATLTQSSGFSVLSQSAKLETPTARIATSLFNSADPTEEEMEAVLEKSKLSDEEIQNVGNLVADDEWMGLGMELSEIIRCAIIEDVKKNTSTFIDKDDYKVGDITKEIDNRVKVS